MFRSITLIAFSLVLAGCPFTTIDQYACPTVGTQLTYDNFGKNFIFQYCQSCHSGNSTLRAGAPGGYDFDTIEQVRRHKARIFVRSAAGNDSMPPGPDDPSLAERMQLAEWLACGAP